MTHGEAPRPVASGASSATAPPSPVRADVVIVGGGLGGLAAALHLRRGGLSVACVEHQPVPHAKVGESFDWSAPRLLQNLGLSMEALVEAGMALYKRGIRVEALGQQAWDAQPAPWFKRKPLKFETVTLNVDRVQFDHVLFELAVEAGTSFVWDRAVAIETEGDRVVSCRTAKGQTLEGSWFIDASGRARLFARQLGIPKRDYGQPKVCLWTYFATAPYSERTTFFGDTSDQYLTWTWDIPITANATSIGCVMPAKTVEERRRTGHDLCDILRLELSKYPRFDALLADQPDFTVRAVSYQSYVNDRTCGPNWFMVGESASLPDPATANGVTAALRHAEDAATYIRKSNGREQLFPAQRAVYDTNVRRMGRVFNHSIETAVYGWTIRRGFGGFVAQRVYTAFSYVVNALYSRLRPESFLSMAVFEILLKVVWLWIAGWATAGWLAYFTRRILRGRRPAATRSASASG